MRDAQLETRVTMNDAVALRTSPPVMNKVVAQPVAADAVAATPATAANQVVTADPPIQKAATFKMQTTAINASSKYLYLASPALDPVALARPTGGIPRSQVQGPMAPNANYSDETLFVDAADASKQSYLPRYRVETQNVSGQDRYHIALEPAGNEWTLTVHLQKFPAPAIEQAAHTATEIAHSVAVIVRYDQMLKGQPASQQELSFAEITNEPGGIKAVLRVDTLSERDQLYAALTDRTYNATLIVRRLITVTVPIPQIRRMPPRPMPPVRRPIGPIGKPMLRPEIDVDPPDRFDPPPPQEQLYRSLARALDQSPDPTPFVFAPALHGYIFSGISVAPGQSFELIRHQTSWQNNAYTYYQDAAQRWVFYYLPDQFKIGRDTHAPHRPLLTVLFNESNGDGSPDSATVNYIALPCVDGARLQAAAAELKAKVTDAVPAGVTVPTFAPMLAPADKIKFELATGQGDANSSPYVERKGAIVELSRAIRDSLTVSIDQFEKINDALFGGSDALFTGRVRVALPGEQEEAIPFAARFNDLSGDIFDYQQAALDNGGLHVTLTNAIESPVDIAKLGATLNRGSASVPGTIQNLDLSKPLRLAPGAQVSFDVVPATPLPADGTTAAVYDLSAVQVSPDRDAVLAAVVDGDVLPSYEAQITVETLETFTAPSDVQAIQVDFENGPSVVLRADAKTAVAKVPRPITVLLSGKADQGTYRYKVRAERASGETVTPDWHTDSQMHIFVFAPKP
jgi:hypothetical protein